MTADSKKNNLNEYILNVVNEELSTLIVFLELYGNVFINPDMYDKTNSLKLNGGSNNEYIGGIYIYIYIYIIFYKYCVLKLFF